jgi:chromosome segregation ATPase
MPVYNEETFFYEVLLRFGETDPNKGKLTGASLTQITQLTKDGAVLNSTINPPEQLALVDGENGQKLSDVLGEVNANTIVQNQTLSTALAAEQGKTESLTTNLSEAEATIDNLNAELTAANAEIERLKALMPNTTLTNEGVVQEQIGTV